MSACGSSGTVHIVVEGGSGYLVEVEIQYTKAELLWIWKIE